MDAVDEVANLRAQLAEREADLATARAELTGAHLLIEQYKAQLHKLRRMKFGRSSEALDAQIHQLELRLEDLEEGEAARKAAANDSPPSKARPQRRQPVRRPLPEHLPREEFLHSAGDICTGCGDTHFSKLGENITEVLEKIPDRHKVIRHIRPKLSCRVCETIIQALLPDLPIEKGRPGPGLLPMSWSRNISTGSRSIANRRFWRAKVSRSSGQPSPIGRPCRLVGVAAGGDDRCLRNGGAGDPHRRHANRGLGARQRQDQDWAHLDLCGR